MHSPYETVIDSKSDTPRVVTIAGTRPEIIKLSELVKLLSADHQYNHALVYTGQHYSANMKDVFFNSLGIIPDIELGCNTSDISAIKEGMVRFLKKTNPEYLLVYGDTSSSVASALAANQTGVKLVHIEAGLRCFDLTVAEERARMHIDSISDYLLPPTQLSRTFLEYEGVDDGSVFITGNLIVDVCRRLSAVADRRRIPDALASVIPDQFVLLTLHRQETVDDPEKLGMVIKHIGEIREKVVFPVHPRTQANIARYGITLPPNVIAIQPLDYMDFLSLLNRCMLVLTDSGGIQEEAIILKKPCITLRNTTERWETILLKANELFPPLRKESLAGVAERMLDVKITRNPYGERTTEATINTLREIIA